MWDMIKPYRKAVMALATAVAIAAWPVYQTVSGDGSLSGDDWRAIALAIGGAVLVYFAPNKPSGDVPPPR